MIPSKLTRVDMNGEPWHDGGGVPLGFQTVMRTQPELLGDEDLAAVIASTANRGRGALVISGVTSSGLLTLKESRAAKVQNGFDVFDFRLIRSGRDLDPYIDRDCVKQGVDERGEYLSFEVPANATIDAVNEWLLANHEDYSLDIEVTTKNNSGIGANVLTGLLGENRRPVEASELTMIVKDKVVKVGQREVDAYRGTQGYAGIVKKVRVMARQRPVNPGMFLLPLTGQTIESALAGSYATVLSHLAPWIYGEKGGVHLSTADMLHLTGLATIHRVEHHGDMTGFTIPRFLCGSLDEEHSSVICMRTEGDVDVANNEDLLAVLATLQDDGHVGEFKVLRSTDITVAAARRSQVPERAREEGGGSDVYSTSMDRDVKILFDQDQVDFSDERTRQSYEAAYQEIIRCYQPLENLQTPGIYLTWNGHFYMTNTPYYYTGGHNPHPRVTGPICYKEQIVQAKNCVMLSLNALHGKKFGCFTICVQEGEKHYPNDAIGQAHFARTQPSQALARARVTAEAGPVHNARAPDPYLASMRQVDCICPDSD